MEKTHASRLINSTTRPNDSCSRHGINEFTDGDPLYIENKSRLRLNCALMCFGFFGLVFGLVGFQFLFFWPFTSDSSMCGSNNTTTSPVSVDHAGTEAEMQNLAEGNTTLPPVFPSWTDGLESCHIQALVMASVEFVLINIMAMLAFTALFSRCPACIASYLFYVCCSSSITGFMMLLNCVIWAMDLYALNCPMSWGIIVGTVFFSSSSYIFVYIFVSSMSIRSSLRHLAPEESCSCCCTSGKRGDRYIRL